MNALHKYLGIKLFFFFWETETNDSLAFTVQN